MTELRAIKAVTFGRIAAKVLITSEANEEVSHLREVKPEVSLLMAILDQAVKDLNATDAKSAKPGSRARLRSNALRYIMSDVLDPDTVSFCWICQTVGLEPDRFREDLIKRGLL